MKLKAVVHPEVGVVNLKITDLLQEHYPEVAAIYREGMTTGIATFEKQNPEWAIWNEKFLPICRFVVWMNNDIAAWCAISKVSKRDVYKGVAEVTIYVASKFRNKGIGKYLLSHLISESEKAGFWTLQAAIFSENMASIRLHERCGFRTLGVREKIGRRDGIWYDNVLMERRSPLF